MRTHAQSVLLQVFVGDDIKDRQANRTRDGVAAEGVEILHTAVKRSGNLRRGHDCRQWMSIANRLAHRDNVGHDALCLKTPEVRADAPKTYLHFVGNADAARI